MVEVHDETTYVKHHKQKIALILSAMRHFADELKKEGVSVTYVKLNDKGNTGSFTGEIHRAIKTLKPSRLIVTEPGEYRVRAMMETWQDAFNIPVEIRDDDRFFATRSEFSEWARSRKELRMEFFYREMRKKSGLLMQGKEPEGGQWNYDSENRKALSPKEKIPERLRFAPDAMTHEVIDLVARRFTDHPGSL